MKKIIVLIFLCILLLPLFSSASTVYSGSGNVLPSNEVSLPLTVDLSSLGTTKVFYGFYTKEGTVGQDSSDNNTYQKLVFKQFLVRTGTDGNTRYYKATASIQFYVYVLNGSGSSLKLSLKWTNLTGKAIYYKKQGQISGKTTTTDNNYYAIPVCITIGSKEQWAGSTQSPTTNSVSKTVNIDTFSASGDVLAHRNYSYTATTGEYSNLYNNNNYIKNYNYKGTMTLILSTT